MFDLYSWPFMPRITLKSGKSVRHQETCPECERKLVNLYPGVVVENEGTIREKRKWVWKCKKCWDKDGGRRDE